jgi:uncharacterized protein (TIGR02646 family)
MLYIHKQNLPKSLADYCNEQLGNGLMPKYEGNWQEDFRKKTTGEQGGLCCYCNNTITHENSTIEHFLPESIYHEEVANYYNLFLVCKHSRGLPKRLQHCDVIKANELIPKYILHPLCETFFAYNDEGEIIPFGNYKRFQDFQKNYITLSADQKMLLATIELLNLNTDSLKSQRRNMYEIWYKEVLEMEENELLTELEKFYKKNEKWVKFYGVYFYLLRKKMINLRMENAFDDAKNNWKNSLTYQNTVNTHKIGNNS